MSSQTPTLFRKFNTFSDFYPFYLGEHSNLTNRRLHCLGTFLFLLILVKNIIFGAGLLGWLIMPVCGYGFAWIGHFFFEKNKPASFKHPLWSFIGDVKMMT
jgi:hypothetical protein